MAKAKRKKIKIYLDTSDYENLRKKNKDKKLLNVLSYLRENINNNTIIIGYSGIVIWELLQNYDKIHKIKEMKKANIVHKICINNCYPHLKNINYNYNFSERGHWYEGPINPYGFRSKEKQALAVARTVFPRINSRQLGHLIRDNIHLLPEGEIDKKMAGLLPKNFLMDLFVKYLIKDITINQAENKVREIFTDLEKFSEMWYKKLGYDNHIREVFFPLSELFAKMINSLREFYKQSEELRSNVESARKLTNVSYFDNPQDFEEFRSSLKIINKNLDRIKEFTILKNLSLSLCNNEEEFNENLLYTYFITNVTRETSRSVRRSDVADLFHAMYLPYCDLWRGDNYFSKMIINSKLSYSYKVVEKLEELPSRVDQLKKLNNYS